jgi:hypothetical protein
MEINVSSKGAKGGSSKGNYAGDKGVAVGVSVPYSPTNGNGNSSKKNYTSMY